MIESGRHVDVALLLLAARHGDQHVVVLPAAHRQQLPPAMPDVPTLVHLYGDTLTDASTLIGRCLLAGPRAHPRSGWPENEDVDVAHGRFVPARREDSLAELSAGRTASRPLDRWR